MELAIILSNIDRYGRENNKLLAGPSADFILEGTGIDPAGAHVRAITDRSPLPSSTTHLLLLGEEAMNTWMGKSGLDAWRGYVELTVPRGVNKPVQTVATYLPIDCIDVKDYEHFGADDDDDDDDSGNGKDTAPTARGNYRFWALRDMRKLFTPFKYVNMQRGLIAPTHKDWQCALAHTNSFVYFDIETHPESNTLQCFSFAVNDGPVYTVGVYDWNGNRVCPPDTLFYLAKLFANNTVVIHNASFDLPFLAINYRLPFGRSIHDTMVMQHRCFPEAEKSLAHAISLWTNAPYHKGDAGTFHPRNRGQFDTLLTYNMRDVERLRDVHKAQLEYAKSDTGLAHSVQRANESIYPYLLSGLHGFGFDLSKRKALIDDLSKRLKFYNRIIKELTGRDLNAGSSKQCVEYFHDQLGYKVVKRSKKTGEPSMAGDAMYLILLDHPENPVPKVILAIRDCEKQLTQLQFSPIKWVWRR